MADSGEFASHIVDLLEPFGRVEAKRMFGGFGIFHQELMIALVSDGNLYLKADAQSKSHFEDQGLEKFSYYKENREHFLSYYQATELFFEDTDECLRWATLASAAAQRAAKKKKPVKKSTDPV